MPQYFTYFFKDVFYIFYVFFVKTSLFTFLPAMPFKLNPDQNESFRLSIEHIKQTLFNESVTYEMLDHSVKEIWILTLAS